MGNIHKRLCTVYGRCAVDRSTVGHWVERVEASGSAETELYDRLRSGRPATATSPDVLQHANNTVHVDRRITSRQLAVQLSVSNGSAMAIIDALGYSKVRQNRFLEVSQTSTDVKGKPFVLSCWSDLMLMGQAFFSRIVTGDETWAHHYEPETKRQSMEWHHPKSSRKNKFNSFRRKVHDHHLLGH